MTLSGCLQSPGGRGGGGEDLAVPENYEPKGLQELGDLQLSRAASETILRAGASHVC